MINVLMVIYSIYIYIYLVITAVIISYEAFETPFEYDVLPSYCFATPLYRATGISAESGESPQSEEREMERAGGG